MGKDGFIWWQGVVEDVDDPLMLGRCRVRCLGWHTEDKSPEGIATEDLPWAYPLQPITSAAISGVGSSPTGLVPGSWVMGFFRDGESAQEPVIMGSIGGIPEKEANVEKGFNDPRTVESEIEPGCFGWRCPYVASGQLTEDPRGNMKGKGLKVHKYYYDGNGAIIVNNDYAQRYPKKWALNEPDTNRLSRGVVDGTIVPRKKQKREVGEGGLLDDNVPTADITCMPVKAGIASQSTAEENPKGKWTEPKTAYDPKYPHNHVYESESGHIMEVDDTPNRERLHRYHRTGTNEEIHPNGDRVLKVVNDSYTTVFKNSNMHIDGFANVTVDKACKIFINQDESPEGAPKFGNFDIHVGKGANLNIHVEEGQINTKITKGDMNVELADGSFYTHVNGNFEHYVSGDYNLRVDGQLRTQSGKNTYMNAGPDIHLNHPGYAGGGAGPAGPFGGLDAEGVMGMAAGAAMSTPQGQAAGAAAGAAGGAGAPAAPGGY